MRKIVDDLLASTAVALVPIPPVTPWCAVSEIEAAARQRRGFPSFGVHTNCGTAWFTFRLANEAKITW